MPELTTIATALTSIKTATDIAKFVNDSGKSLDDAETKLKLAELVSSLADTKMTIANIQQELITKNEEIRELKDNLKLKGKMEFKAPYYYLKDLNKKDGPYCQCCYDNDNKTIRLYNGSVGYWSCAVCKNNFTDDDYTPPKVNFGVAPDV